MQCCYCGSILSTIQILNNHQKRSKKCKSIQNGDYTKLINCKLCDKRFISENSKKNHKCKDIENIYIKLKNDNQILKEENIKLKQLLDIKNSENEKLKLRHNDKTINTGLKFIFNVDKHLRDIEKTNLNSLFLNNYVVKSKINL